MANGFQLEKCRAVITGASGGLGAEFARQLAPHADTLVLVARRAEALEMVKQELSSFNATILCCVADLATDAGRNEVMTFLETHDVRPNLLINNAGLGDYGSFASSTAEKTRTQIELNITALTMLTHALLPLLCESAGNHALASMATAGVLNVSSLASMLPMPDLAVYAASKSYVTSFSEALAIEMAPKNVIVSCVCPGPTPTNFSQTAKREDGTDTNREGQSLLRIPPSEVVSRALMALQQREACVFPGVGVSIAGRLFRLMPRSVMRWLLKRRHGKE
ncbi:MAG: SDR family NAD(P)-dependent oxidoreductase [Prosthecobacter sp.]